MKKENTIPNSCAIGAKNSCCSTENTTQKKDLIAHWNEAYKNAEIKKLGWYEETPEPSLRLIEKCHLSTDAVLLNVGAGATTLVDELLNLGYTNILVNDLSSKALDALKERLEIDNDTIKWVVDDLTAPTELNNLEKVDIWHDRAVLHFFNEQKDQDTYFNLVKSLVKKNGFVIIAAFNLQGATKCSGLPVHQYNKEMLQEKLGHDFTLIEAFDHTYIMPSEETREYVYTLFQRK